MSPYTPPSAYASTSSSSPPLGNPSSLGSTLGRLLSRKRRKYLGIVLFVGALLAVWDVNLRREAGEWDEGGVATGAGGGLGGKLWGDIDLGKLRSGVFGSGRVVVEDEEDAVVPGGGGLSGELDRFLLSPSLLSSLSVLCSRSRSFF